MPHAVSEIYTADFPGSTIFELMRGSSHIQSVLICIEHGNCRRTLDVGRFTIWIGQIQSKLLNGLLTNGLDDM